MVKNSQFKAVKTGESTHPDTRHRPNVEPMLVHRLRRWPIIGPALVQSLVFA